MRWKPLYLTAQRPGYSGWRGGYRGLSWSGLMFPNGVVALAATVTMASSVVVALRRQG